jgi:hypothetical protein
MVLDEAEAMPLSTGKGFAIDSKVETGSLVFKPSHQWI